MMDPAKKFDRFIARLDAITEALRQQSEAWAEVHPLNAAKCDDSLRPAASCHTCVFFEREHLWGPGECRRHAPLAHVVKASTYQPPVGVVDPRTEAAAYWPTVEAIDWCGEYVLNQRWRKDDAEWAERTEKAEEASERQARYDREFEERQRNKETPE